MLRLLVSDANPCRRALAPVFFLMLLAAQAGCLGSLDLHTDVGARDTGFVPLDGNDGSDGGGNPTLDVGPDAGADAGPDASEPDLPPPDPVLGDVVREVFSVSCTPCHTDRVSGGMSLLDRPGLRDSLLGPSTQAPDVARITPGDPDASYLWLKLMGRHEEVGGIGERMPLSGSVTAAQLDLIERWILAGALP